jgi:hypothetical protein
LLLAFFLDRLGAEPSAGGAVAKIWRIEIGPLGYCKSLKSHKTAKGFFGKIWKKKG